MKTSQGSLIARAEKIIEEIDELFLDCEHWNRLHPTEAPLDADPGGEMRALRRYCEESIAKLTSGRG